MAFSPAARRYAGFGLRRGGRATLGPMGVVLPFASGTFSRSSDATHLTSATSIATVGSNVLRKEDRGDGRGAVPLFEGAATNLLHHSRDIGSYSGSSGTTVVNTDAETGPIDGIAADTIEFTGGTNASRFDNTGAKFAAVNHTMSLWFKRITGTIDQTDVHQTFQSAAGRYFLPTGTPEGWQRASTVGLGNVLHNIGQSLHSPGSNNVTVAFDGLQLETGDFPTSFIQPTGSPTARDPDDMSFAAYSDVMRLGRWKMRWDPIYAHGEANATHTLLDFDSSVTENNVYFDQATNSIRVRVGGVQVLSQAITFSRYPWIELAFNWVTRELTITGATTGDGTYAITGVANWPANTLYWAQRHDASSPDFARTTEPEAW